jgi:hypothetical protein
MTPASLPAGWTAAQLLHEVLTTPRRTVLRLPDTQVLERDDLLQIITPSLPHGGLNEVAYCRFPAGVADREIDAALARFEAAGVRSRWGVLPDCLPIDLSSRLAARGLVGSPIDALYRFGARASGAASTLDAQVERVTRETVEEYTRLMAEGWHLEAEGLLTYNLAAVEDARVRLYLARVDGEPAGVASAMLSDASVFLQGALVSPRFREKGLYRTLVERRVADALAEGRSLAFTHALATTSAPRLRRMGFQELFRFESFSRRP